MKINAVIIKKDFKNDYISREAGEKLRLIILENHKNNIVTELDFSGIIVASTSFFDESIAKLALEEWDKEQLNTFVVFKNINKLDMDVLNKIREYRKI